MKDYLVFVPNLQGGGAEKIAVNLSNSLSDENNTYLMFLNENKLKKNKLNKKLTLLKLNKTRLIFSILNIIKFLYDTKNETVIISFLNAPNLLFCLIKFSFKFKKIKLVLTIHNSMSNNYQDSNLKGKIIILLLKYFSRYSSKIICVSKFVKNDLKKNWNFDVSKLITIYNPAINEDEIKLLSSKFNPFINNFKKKNFNVILSIGRLTKQKNYHLLIDSFYKVSKKIDNIILIILGVGELKNELYNLVKQKKLVDKVYFLGFQQNPYNYIYNSDLVVLSSDWEGLPTVLIESLYLKKKIVSTNCKGGCSEILDNGKYGYLTPANNSDKLYKKIILALNSPKKKVDQIFLKQFIDKNVLKKYNMILNKI